MEESQHQLSDEGRGEKKNTYVATGEVTALEHELGDNAVEGRALVAEALLTSAESTEVLGSLGNNVVVEVEVDAAALGCWQEMGLSASRVEQGQESMVRG